MSSIDLMFGCVLCLVGVDAWLLRTLRSERLRHAAQVARLREGDFRRWLASLPRHPVEPDVFCPRGVVYLVNTDTLRHSRDDESGAAS